MATLVTRNRRPTRAVVTGTVAAGLGALATWVALKARRAELTHRPEGAVLTVDGVRLHYIERGRGAPVVLLHGNVVHAKDFFVSGLVDQLAEQYRVIVFDRPGFGHSERPRNRAWTASAQAAILARGLAMLDVEDPVVLGHSWGTLVALELALQAHVRKLVLVSGYYFPTARPDVVFAAPPAIPVIGDVLRYTVSPVFARLMLNKTLSAMFAPQQVPADYLAALSRELLVRPSQIRANAEDAAFMIPAAASLRKRYAGLNTPVAIFAGEADSIVKPDRHARRLHRELSGSELHVVPGVGHMVHHAVPQAIAAAVSSAPRIRPQRESAIHVVRAGEALRAASQ